MRSLSLAYSSSLLCGCIFVATVAASNVPSLVPENFAYTANVSASLAKGSLYRIHLDAGILDRCLPDKADVRLFDGNGKPVPFALVESRPTEARDRRFRFRVLTYDDDEDGIALTVKAPGDLGPIALLTLDTPDRDYRKNVAIYGSFDKIDWSPLAKDVIFDLSSHIDLRKNHVNLGSAEFPFYKVVLSDGGPVTRVPVAIELKYDGLDFTATGGGNRRIKIAGVTGERVDAADAFIEVDEASLPVSAEKDPDGNSVLNLETGLFTDRLYLDTSLPYYYRSVDILTSEDGKKGSYQSVGKDYIYRFPFRDGKDSRTYIERRGPPRRYVRLVVENRGNPPLDLKRVRLRWNRRYLYFIPLEDGNNYTVAFGNRAVGPPDFDISQFVNQDNWYRLSARSLLVGKIRHNDNVQPLVLKNDRSHLEKRFFVLVVGLLALGLSAWIFTLARRTR